MKLEGKRILFIAPAFFGYEQKIADKMTELGAKVDYFDERSVTSSYERALLKINPQIFHKKTLKYYKQIIEKVSESNYDFVFVIKCEMLPIQVITKMKDMFRDATFCLYLYDSLENIKGITNKLDYFDRVLSFDTEDSSNDSRIIFRPLFFTDDYKKELIQKEEYEFDVSFIGTIHSDRYRVIKEIKNLADKNQYNYYFYCYLQSKFMYYFYKLTKREFSGVKKEDFEFIKIQSTQIAEIIDKTRVVLDIQHPRQTGLTMRTIEMIGMNKKLITTNQSIKEYDFYKPENIAVIDRNAVKIPDGFLELQYKKIDEHIYMKYSLENWINVVLGVESDNYKK
ncbi:capsular biosynthesis protein CpsH [Halocella sp. SP3-1]|uniref:capsular biosynthesis protein CpsH n=1 Tax=Halocella sp. SP3-1 TaxID=2382161 RepID=UPI0026D2EBD2